MIEKFKKKLKENGQNLKWFYDKTKPIKADLTYSGFAGQLNGYSPLSKHVKKAMVEYLES